MEDKGLEMLRKAVSPRESLTTGSWEETTSNYISRVFTQTMGWVEANQSKLILSIGVTLVLCGMVLGIRVIWLQWFHERFLELHYNWIVYPWRRFIKRPYQWAFKPFRRMHRRWSERNLRAKMAKFEKRHLADIFIDGLYKGAEEGVISRQTFKKVQAGLAVFFDLPDLNRKKTHPKAVAHEQALKKEKIKERKGKVPGPLNKIPGGKPGENTTPMYKGIGHSYLAKKAIRESKT